MTDREERYTCLICLQRIVDLLEDEAGVTERDSDIQLYGRFLLFAGHHLKMGQSSLISLFPPVIKIREDGPNHCQNLNVFCARCRSDIYYICRLYEGLCEIRVKLNLVVVALGELMERSTKKVTSLDVYQTLAEQLRRIYEFEGDKNHVRKMTKQLIRNCKMVAPSSEIKVERFSQNTGGDDDEDDDNHFANDEFQLDIDELAEDVEPEFVGDGEPSESKMFDPLGNEGAFATQQLALLPSTSASALLLPDPVSCASINNTSLASKRKTAKRPTQHTTKKRQAINVTKDNSTIKVKQETGVDQPVSKSKVQNDKLVSVSGEEHPSGGSGKASVKSTRKKDPEWEPPKWMKSRKSKRPLIKRSKQMVSGVQSEYIATRRKAYPLENAVEDELADFSNDEAPQERTQLCDICKSAVEVSKVEHHLKEHLGETAGWKCLNCERTFATRFVLLNHMKVKSSCRSKPICINDPRCRHVCSICVPETTFAEHSELFDHIFSTHEKDCSLEKGQRCKICLMKYRTELGLDFHFNVHVRPHRRHFTRDEINCFYPPDTGEMSLCKFCKNEIANEGMEEHVNSVHADRGVTEFFKCILCPGREKTFTNREDYLVHLNKSHKTEEKPCDVCWSVEGKIEVFARIFQIREHLYNFHGIGSKLTCDHCTASYFTADSLEQHVIVMHPETNPKVVWCELCLKSGKSNRAMLTSQEGLENHMKKCHRNDQFECSRCPGQFRCKFDFLEHEKNEHGEDPLICCECGKQYVHTHILEAHEKTHSGKKSSHRYVVIKCDTCGKDFPSRSSLSKHMPVHMDILFQCEQCGKEFKREDSLNKHRLTHLPGGTPKPFICEYCSRGFQSKALLAQHVRIHTGERPFACKLCTNRFRQRTSLWMHEKSHRNANFKQRGTFDREIRPKNIP